MTNMTRRIEKTNTKRPRLDWETEVDMKAKKRKGEDRKGLRQSKRQNWEENDA